MTTRPVAKLESQDRTGPERLQWTAPRFTVDAIANAAATIIRAPELLAASGPPDETNLRPISPSMGEFILQSTSSFVRSFFRALRDVVRIHSGDADRIDAVHVKSCDPIVLSRCVRGEPDPFNASNPGDQVEEFFVDAALAQLMKTA